MSKKIVYIAHSISGDIDANLSDLARIIRVINMNINPSIHGLSESTSLFIDIIPIAPYYVDIIALDDSKPLERRRGIENNIAMLESGIFKELWLTGDKISFGMQEEVNLAVKLGIPVINYIGKF